MGAVSMLEFLKREGITPQAGDYFLTHGSDLFGKLIRWRTGGHWSHAGLVTGPNATLEMLVRPGVHIGTLRDHREQWVYMRYCGLAPLAPGGYHAECKRIERTKGTPEGKYDIKGILGALFYAAKWNDPVRAYCSEIVAGAFRAGGVECCPRRPVEQIWPQHLFEWSDARILGFSTGERASAMAMAANDPLARDTVMATMRAADRR